MGLNITLCSSTSIYAAWSRVSKKQDRGSYRAFHPFTLAYRDPGRSHSTSFRRRVWRVKLIKPKQYIRNHGLAYLAPLFYRLKTCQGFICLQAIFTIFCLCLKVNFNYIFCILESYSNDIKTWKWHKVAWWAVEKIMTLYLPDPPAERSGAGFSRDPTFSTSRMPESCKCYKPRETSAAKYRDQTKYWICVQRGQRSSTGIANNYWVTIHNTDMRCNYHPLKAHLHGVLTP